jgi:hypothetical protein
MLTSILILNCSYDYNKLNEDELDRLEEVNDWIEKLNKKYKF